MAQRGSAANASGLAGVAPGGRSAAALLATRDDRCLVRSLLGHPAVSAGRLWAVPPTPPDDPGGESCQAQQGPDEAGNSQKRSQQGSPEASDARGDSGQIEDFSESWHGDWSSWHEDGQPGQEAASVPEEEEWAWYMDIREEEEPSNSWSLASVQPADTSDEGQPPLLPLFQDQLAEEDVLQVLAECKARADAQNVPRQAWEREPFLRYSWETGSRKSTVVGAQAVLGSFKKDESDAQQPAMPPGTAAYLRRVRVPGRRATRGHTP